MTLNAAIFIITVLLLLRFRIFWLLGMLSNWVWPTDGWKVLTPTQRLDLINKRWKARI